MSRFAKEFYETAANEVAQHNVVRGIMARAYSDAGGDEKKAIAYYIKYRAAQLAQEAREELRQKRRAASVAAKQRAASTFQPASRFWRIVYAFMSVLCGLFALLFALLFAFIIVAEPVSVTVGVVFVTLAIISAISIVRSYIKGSEGAVTPKVLPSSNVNQGDRQGWDFLRLALVLCLGLLLLNTYRLYKGAYFGADDLRNLYWVQQTDFRSMIGFLVDPISLFFRPAGMMCYWVLLRFFDLDPAAYHGFLRCLHALNTALIYLILKRLTESRAGATVGAALFASPVVFAEIYWNFGTIFDVVATFFTFVAILLWISEARRWSHVLLASMTLLLAMKGKEMAVTMPLVLLSYDLLVRQNLSRRIVAQWILPCGLALWYGLTKALRMKGAMPTHPYYMSINASTLGSGFGFYLNMLFQSNFPWQIWCVAAAVLLLIFVLSRSRLAIFFQLYVFITFLPVIFLVNHRFAFYWYLPLLGMCGFAAILSKDLMRLIPIRNPQWLTQVAATCLFVVLCWGIFVLQKETNRRQRSWIRTLADENRGFIAGLRSLPPPQPAETIYFDSLPPHFDVKALLAATQVAFGRTDLRVKLVTEFPPGARYRMRFQDSHLIRVSQ